jgi:hypothetical protein
MSKVVVEIEKEHIDNGRLDFIAQSFSLALKELGHPQINIHRLEDEKGSVRFEMIDNSDTVKCNCSASCSEK